jgi:cobalt-zinc-cadmium efflux system outer membrane protein
VQLTAIVGGVLALGVAPPLAAQAQAAGDTLRLAEAVALAREANPTLAAAWMRADAARYRSSQIGTLPDPQVTLGLMNRPLSGFGAGEPMTMNVLGLSQTFPWPGKLGFGAERERALADADSLAAGEVERQLVARVTGVYADLAATDRSIAILLHTRDLLRTFLTVSQTRYAVGDAPQQDVLQAQVDIARVSEDVTAMEQDRVALAARLNALLGREATTPVPALDQTQPGEELPSADSLMTLAASRRPALLAAREREHAADAAYRQARRALYPDVTASVQYVQRPQFDDMLSFMVGFTIPLWAGGRQLPLRREMDAKRAEDAAMTRDLANETFASLTQLRATAERARRLSALYQQEILPQARAAVEASLSAYRVGRADFMTLVESELTVNRYEIESVRLAAEWQRAVAAITALAGDRIGGNQ